MHRDSFRYCSPFTIIVNDERIKTNHISSLFRREIGSFRHKSTQWPKQQSLVSSMMMTIVTRWFKMSSIVRSMRRIANATSIRRQLKLMRRFVDRHFAAVDRRCRSVRKEHLSNRLYILQKRQSTNSISSSSTTKRNSSNDDDDNYIVETILSKRMNRGTIEYYLRWKGYTDADNTWEPIDNLDCDALIDEFEHKYRNTNRLQTTNDETSTTTVSCEIIIMKF